MSEWRVYVPELKLGTFNHKPHYYFVTTCIHFADEAEALALFNAAMTAFNNTGRERTIRMVRVTDD